MKLVIQRVNNAHVKVNHEIVGETKKGFLVFIGITHTDTEKEANYLAKKLCNLRVFEDEQGKMNLSLKEVGGQLLIVSQFTLYANCENGNRPDFIAAAKPEMAQKLYEYFCKQCREQGLEVQTGKFREHMEVYLLNDGPVTIIMEK